MNTDEMLPIIKKINKAFYHLVFKDEWLKDVFSDVPQEHIENQQTDFMLRVLGGPKLYRGRMPKDAHVHVFITQEMLEHRESLLIQAFDEVNAPKELREKWLKVDRAFWQALIKNSPNECFGRYKTEPIIVVENPRKKVA